MRFLGEGGAAMRRPYPTEDQISPPMPIAPRTAAAGWFGSPISLARLTFGNLDRLTAPYRRKDSGVAGSQLPELDVERVRRWCSQRVPGHLRDQVRVDAMPGPGI